MKRIFFFSTLESVPWGGSEQLWSDMALRLLAKGHKVMTNTLIWDKQPEALSAIEQQGGILTYRPNLHAAAGIVNKTINRIDALKWKRDVYAFEPDVIIISAGGTFDNGILQFGDWLKTLEQPIYVICQYQHEFDYLEKERRQFFGTYFNTIKNVFFVSTRNKEVTERTLARSVENGIVIKNPIKLKNTTTSYPDTEVYNIATVARLEVPVKGFDLLVQVFAQEQWQERNYKVNVYGSGVHEEYIKQLVAFSNLQDKIIFHGHTKDVQQIWEQNHILLLPSRGEGTPLSLLEAGFCKRAAIVTDVGGNCEVVQDGLNGFVADAPVVKCVSDAAERAWENRKQWKQMGIAAKERIDELYKTDPIDDLLALIIN